MQDCFARSPRSMLLTEAASGVQRQRSCRRPRRLLAVSTAPLPRCLNRLVPSRTSSGGAVCVPNPGPSFGHDLRPRSPLLNSRCATAWRSGRTGCRASSASTKRCGAAAAQTAWTPAFLRHHGGRTGRQLPRYCGRGGPATERSRSGTTGTRSSACRRSHRPRLGRSGWAPRRGIQRGCHGGEERWSAWPD